MVLCTKRSQRMRFDNRRWNSLLVFLFQNMLNRRSFSDVLPESPKSARKKEEARQAEFVRIGQVGFILTPVLF